MKYYPITVGNVKRNLPICPLNDSLQIAGFVIVGDPELSEGCAKELSKKVPEYDYILNTSSKKFHSADCSNGQEMTGSNRSDVTCTRQELIDKGYKPAGCCNP